MYSINYDYLRPEKVKMLRQWCDAPLAARREPEIWQGCHATILPLRRLATDNLQFGRGGVVDAEGNYVELSGIPRRVQYAYPFENPDYKDEKVVYCGYLIDHWGHFLIEAVTRLWYFLENDPTVDKYVFFLDENEPREIRGNFREFLELLRIWDKLEIINRPTTYREVIVPELGIHVLNSYVPKLMDVFETVANNAAVDPSWETPEKIYFSRSQFKKAQAFEFGFDTLDNFFAKNGYTILFPEKVSLSRMIHYIRHAEVVATLSGTLSHNMLFAARGQKLEIVERQVISDDDQSGVNRMKELNVTYIDANIPLYPIDCVGPYIMGYTPELQRFARDHGYADPDPEYTTEKRYRTCFIKYMKAYIDLYNYNWFMSDWYGPFADSLYEGYRAGCQYFADYIERRKPYRWYHYFQFHYWKQFIKRLLHAGA